MGLDRYHVACTAIGQRLVIARLGKDPRIALDQRECEGEIMAALVNKFLRENNNVVHKFKLKGVPYELTLSNHKYKRRRKTMTLKEEDQRAADVAVAPRVTLDGIINNITETYYCTGEEAVVALPGNPAPAKALKLLTICIVVLKNGYTIVGTSACASPENYNQELGRKIAYENCIRQIWPLMGFALRDKLSNATASKAAGSDY